VSNDAAEAAAATTPYEGVDAAEWKSMVDRGSAAGVLNADDIAHVRRKVELTGDVLVEVHTTRAGFGIVIDDHVDELSDITAPMGLPSVADRVPDDDEEDTEGLIARRRRKRNLRSSHERSSESGGTADTVRMYLKEIGRVDLLTVDDERRLAQAIDDGNNAAARLDAELEGSPLTDTERRRLLRAVHNGQRAKSELIQANLRLVVSIASATAGAVCSSWTSSRRATSA